jgi:hypothetical protein
LNQKIVTSVRRAGLAALLALIPAAAFSEELAGTRTLALQGAHASPYDNAAIFTNAAGTAANSRYDVSAFGDLQRHTENRLVHLSVVDSLSSPQLGGGLGWNRTIGKELPRDDIAMALAQRYPYGAFGVTGHYRIDRERSRRTDVNMDAGILLHGFGDKLMFGAAGYNLTPAPKTVHNVHRRYTAGLASRWFDLFEVTADGGYNPGFAKGTKWDWAAGAEISPLPYFAIRGGYGQFPSGPDRKPQFTAGLGAGSAGDFKVGYTYKQVVGDPQHAVHAADVSVFVF